MGTGQDDRSLTDLTSEMTGWKTGTGADLMLDDGMLNVFLGRLQLAQDGMDAQLTGANGLRAWLAGTNVGEYVSADQTRNNLVGDIDQFIEAVERYKQYLESVRTTTDAARWSYRHTDQPR